VSLPPAIKLPAAALGAALCAALAGCSETYRDRLETVSPAVGDAMAANRVTHMIDPWPAVSGRRDIAYNGEKAQSAAERYRTGKVIPPVNATTSSAAYTQVQPAAPSNSNAPAASAPGGGQSR
jgi:hypothetical protein